MRRAAGAADRPRRRHARSAASPTCHPRTPTRARSTLRRARLAGGARQRGAERRRRAPAARARLHARPADRRLDGRRCPRSASTSTREIDLIEEVGTPLGTRPDSGHVPGARVCPAPIGARRRPRPARASDALRRRPAGSRHLHVHRRRGGRCPYPTDDAVTITNPLSEKFAVLRPSIACRASLSRSSTTAIGRPPTSASSRSARCSRRARRTHAVGWVLTGVRGTHWSGNAGPLDLHRHQGHRRTGRRGRRDAASRGDGRRSAVARARRTRGGARRGPPCGMDWPAWRTRAPSMTPVYAASSNSTSFEPRVPPAASARSGPLPRFPSVVRDLSILVDERLPAADVRGTIRSSAPTTLVAVREFDRYQGKGVPDGSGQPVASTHLPTRRSHADGRRSAAGCRRPSSTRWHERTTRHCAAGDARCPIRIRPDRRWDRWSADDVTNAPRSPKSIRSIASRRKSASWWA